MFRCTGICKNCKACGDIGSIDILTSFMMPDTFISDGEDGLGVAIDVGTTTIATALWDMGDGKLLSQKSSANPQRNFGGDVVSRTAYAMKSADNYKNIRYSLINKINSIIGSYFFDIDENGISENFLNDDNELSIDGKVLKRIYLSGNRVMTSILLGDDIKSISKYPYDPVSLDAKSLDWDINIKNGDSYLNCGRAEAYIVSCSFSNIGGDIISGLVSLSDLDEDENVLFLDLGTNGECIIKAKDKMVGFSAAAGPAFEGGNIKNGVFAQRGAISKISIENDSIYLEFIDDIKPLKSPGICGSGLIFAIGSLVETKLINADGAIANYDYVSRINPYSSLNNRIDDGKIIILNKSENSNKEIAIYQNDIREFQLAKGAVLAGINIALRKIGIDTSDIDRIILAGGFGKSISKEALISSGILPRGISGSLSFVGNTSLAGTSMIMMMKKIKEKSERLSKEIDVIELSLEENFQEDFMRAMYF